VPEASPEQAVLIAKELMKQGVSARSGKNSAEQTGVPKNLIYSFCMYNRSLTQ
jgi:hypothetical protein